MIYRSLAIALGLAATPIASLAQEPDGPALTYGVRPAYIISQMAEGPLKDRLGSCLGQTPERSKFSIGHRGAALMFPEHSAESHRAAAAMGAGILECDVTFTADKALVCRHAQNDLHTTTDILVSDLADTCATPFTPATDAQDAQAECRTSDLTLDQFLTLSPKMDAADAQARTPEAYIDGTADWRTDLYAQDATLLTHAQSIALIDQLDADFTPELKAPAVDMPFDGMTQADYAQKMIDAYKSAGIDPSRVWPQSFNLDDIRYWIENEPEFARQAVYLDDRYSASDDDEGLIDPMDAATFKPTMTELAEMGINYIAPPMWMLVTLDESGAMVPSVYAEKATEAGLGLITWTLERSGPLGDGGGWYFQSVTEAVDNAGAYFEILDVLAQDVQVAGVFSDWPATTTFYANCMGL